MRITCSAAAPRVMKEVSEAREAPVATSHTLPGTRALSTTSIHILTGIVASMLMTTIQYFPGVSV